MSTFTPKLNRRTRFSEIVFFSVLKIFPCFEKVISYLQTEVRSGVWRKRFVFKHRACFLLQVFSQVFWAFCKSGFKTTCWDPYYLIWGVFVQSLFLFCQVHTAQTNCSDATLGNGPGSLHWTRETGLQVVSVHVHGTPDTCLWGLIWEDSFCLI